MPSEEARTVLGETSSQVRACTSCRLHLTRTCAVPGEGPSDASVLLLGEAPGQEEDRTGRPFMGSAGKILDRALRAAKLPRDRVFITNVVKCRPPANRRPKSDEVAACRPYLLAQIAALRPRVIVALGSTSLRALTGSDQELKAARETDHAFGGHPVLATYHPAAILYNRKLETDLRADLRKASKLVRRPHAAVRSGPPRKSRPMRAAVSSGGVIADGQGRILLLKRADESLWCLPKGTQEPGETLEATALREIREECGLEVHLVGLVRTIRYAYFWPPENVNYDKAVTYYLAEPTGGRLRLESGFDEARWVSRPEALDLLHWKNDRDVVSKAFDVLGSRRS